MKFSSMLAALFAANVDAATTYCECNHSISSNCKMDKKSRQNYVKYTNYDGSGSIIKSSH